MWEPYKLSLAILHEGNCGTARWNLQAAVGLELCGRLGLGPQLRGPPPQPAPLPLHSALPLSLLNSLCCINRSASNPPTQGKVRLFPRPSYAAL